MDKKQKALVADRLEGADVRKFVCDFNGCVLVTRQWLMRVADTLDADAAHAGDAAEWRAFAVVRDHRMKLNGEPVIMFQDGTVRTIGVVDAVVDAPTPVALLAKLDALAEAAKPKDVWRLRMDDGSVVNWTGTPEQLRHAKGHPVREVTRPDGVIELHPEGEV